MGFLDVFIAAADVSNAAGELSSRLGLKKRKKLEKKQKSLHSPRGAKAQTEVFCAPFVFSPCLPEQFGAAVSRQPRIKRTISESNAPNCSLSRTSLRFFFFLSVCVWTTWPFVVGFLKEYGHFSGKNTESFPTSTE